MKSFICAVSIFSFAGIATNSFANEYTCLSSNQAMAQFHSGEIKNQSYYDEAPHGGARVQKQHPKTYMFAQAKHIVANGRSGAICQYSNHVGLVSTYYVLDMKPQSFDYNCSKDICKNKARWRKEWSYSIDSDDDQGREMMNVCVKAIDGVDYPSSKCVFIPAPVVSSN